MAIKKTCIYPQQFPNLGKRLGDVKNLPDELKNQLQICNLNDEEERILEVFQSLEGYASIDEVMVGLYRKFNIIANRQLITNRLYRMKIKGLLNKIAGKKGIYANKNV